jgi:hypothetical protein
MKKFVSLLKKVLIRSNNIKFGWFCIFLFLFFPFFTYGDGVAWGFDGHNLYPIENDSIKLVSELLKMQQSGMNVKTHCWYLLKNITNNPQNLTIGFYIGDDNSYYFKKSDLKVYVDGEETDYQKKIIEDTTSLGFIEEIYGIWDMSFLPNESKMIYVEQILRWSEGGKAQILSGIGEWFIYKLNLASKWAGKPERIEVYYDFGDSFPSYDTLAFGKTFSIKDTLWGINKSIMIKPEGYNWVNDKKLVWVFENTDSIDDIKINIDLFGKKPSIENVLSMFTEMEYSDYLNETDKKLFNENNMDLWTELSPKSLKEFKKIKNRYEIYKIVLKYYPAFLRNGIYAKHGYKFKSKLWKDVFSKFDWYHPRDSFNESELNSFERKNIKFKLYFFISQY